MKRAETYLRCENCDAMILEISPPTKEQYKQGLIELGMRGDICSGGSVLLDVKDKPNKSVAHSADLRGAFCDWRCLLEYILRARGEKWPEVLRKEPR